jgi:hypothetical protein
MFCLIFLHLIIIIIVERGGTGVLTLSLLIYWSPHDKRQTSSRLFENREDSLPNAPDAAKKRSCARGRVFGGVVFVVIGVEFVKLNICRKLVSLCRAYLSHSLLLEP